jgi:flagella basal body P-ring formation protein FlgA
MIQLALLALAACLPVSPDSDHIVAQDLAPALPSFAGIPPETRIALAPAPGVQRVFRPVELRRLAAQWALEITDGEVCVERIVKPLDPARLLEAMLGQLPGARIAIRDFSRAPVPEGELDFSLGGLRMTPAGALWTGAVRYAGTRRFAIWAKVEVGVTESRVVAAQDIKPARAIEAGKLRLETREYFPSAEPLATAVDEIAGKIARRPIPAGTAICLACVEAGKEVSRGETVRVEVHFGGAFLEMEGRAEAAGSTGETIAVLNPETRRRFQARVRGKGRVSVEQGRE